MHVFFCVCVGAELEKKPILLKLTLALKPSNNNKNSTLYSAFQETEGH